MCVDFIEYLASVVYGNDDVFYFNLFRKNDQMKSFAGIAFNFFRTVKSSSEDKNQENLYAEANIIFHEPAYEITNMGKVAKSATVGEVELMLTKGAAESIRDSMNEIIDFFESQEPEEVSQ